MKKIVKYEDNSGHAWDTEKEATIADARLILKNSINGYINDSNTTREFNIDRWIKDTKGKPDVIGALIYLLDINYTKIQAERLFEHYKERK